MPKSDGRLCPKCKRRPSRIIRVIQDEAEAVTRRRHECRSCGHRWWSAQHDEKDPEKPDAPLSMVM